jgi:hypothetical protein
MHVGFWWENQRERGHQEDLDVGRRVILRWIFEIWDEEQRWALVNTVMNIGVP